MTAQLGGRRRASWSARRQLVVFGVVAVLASWWPWPLTLLDPTSTPFVPWGPAAGALLVTALACGRRGLRDLLGALVRWRVHPAWYAVALLGPVVLIGAPVGAVALLVPTAVTPAPWPGWSMLPLLFAVRTIIGGALTEELGWRGFLLPRLSARYGAALASLLVGLSWGLWHLPLFLAGPAVDQRPPVQFLLWAVPLSVVHTWLYLRTRGSVLIVTLFHGGIDTAASVLMPHVTGASYGLVWWLLVAATTGWALPLLRRLHREGGR